MLKSLKSETSAEAMDDTNPKALSDAYNLSIAVTIRSYNSQNLGRSNVV